MASLDRDGKATMDRVSVNDRRSVHILGIWVSRVMVLSVYSRKYASGDLTQRKGGRACQRQLRKCSIIVAYYSTPCPGVARD
jgi:hypothetical protein